MVEFSPATREAWVRFPANADLTLKIFKKPFKKTLLYKLPKHINIHIYKEFKMNYPVMGVERNSASARHHRLANKKLSARYGYFFNRPLVSRGQMVGHCYHSYLNHRTWRRQVCINLDACKVTCTLLGEEGSHHQFSPAVNSFKLQ